MKGRAIPWRRRLWAWVLIALIAPILAWRLTAELIEPHLLLWLGPHAPYLEAPAIAGTTLRLYADTRPHVGKIAGLQKGLVWVRGGRPLVEEGYGFGCPIVVYDGLAYLSRHAEIEMAPTTVGTRFVKRYAIDTADTPIQFLRRKYRPVPSLGEVVYTYDVHPGGMIDVVVDLSGLTVDWARVYLMNEQGAQRFPHYYDTLGRALSGDEIGIWEPSAAFIARGCFESPDRDLRFCVEAQPPATVYYGRERYRQYNWRGTYYLSWSGVDIELEAPRERYAYRITLEAG
ncbi:MAG: hypothetical protein JXA09_10165 [Anaerolineae bacterium]|nr:hypothetical protein [Anaerolineae bacterium]